MKGDPAQILDAISRLQARCDDIPSPYPNRDPYDRAVAALMADIAILGGQLKADWNVLRCRLFGETSTSTSGAVNAVRNWIAKVHPKAFTAFYGAPEVNHG
jgi:hypothetical protein